MFRFRSRFSLSYQLTLGALCVLAATLSGCSSEAPKPTQDELVALRKSKDNALDRMLNPNGAAPKAKGKGKAKADPFEGKYLP